MLRDNGRGFPADTRNIVVTRPTKKGIDGAPKRCNNPDDEFHRLDIYVYDTSDT